MAPSIRARALAYIRDGRVAVVKAVPDPSQAVPARPCLVEARVRGHQCAHTAAVALVVGWPSAAALSTLDPEGPTS